MKMKKPSWIKPLEVELRTQEGVTRFLGSSDAETVLIAPIPTAFELQYNLPWCSPAAVWFYDNLAAQCGITPDDLLVVPTTFDGKKPVKANTEFGKRVIEAAAQSEQIKRFICIGADAFKVFFGFGKKPPQSIFQGTPVQTRESNYKPLLVFPNPALVMGNNYDSKRDYAIALQFVEQTRSRYIKIMTELNKLLQ